MKAFTVVIPVRFASSRLPGKALRPIAGRPMLQHVWEKAKASRAEEVVIATDDDRIAAAAAAFGADVCMTAREHRSGSERIAEVCRIRSWPGERVLVNLQGDEPLMPPPLIDHCASLLDEPGADMATLASPFETSEDFDDPNVVKALVRNDGLAIYFSRAPLPWAGQGRYHLALRTALQHHGIYAYAAAVLQELVAAPCSPLEECEGLEQLRALSLGLRIRVGIPGTRPGPGVDTEADLGRVERLMAGRRATGG